MADLIAEVRNLSAASTAEYSIGAIAYWTDDQIQGVLDANRKDIVDEALYGQVEYDNTGQPVYHEYRSQYRWLEETVGGTAIFYLRDSAGPRVGTADYTVDYRSGRVSLIPNTMGTVYYMTGRTYDVYAAAASIWRTKAAHVAQRFDFSADGASFKASQLRSQYLDMANELDKKATFGENTGVRSVTMYRDDVSLW